MCSHLTMASWRRFRKSDKWEPNVDICLLTVDILQKTVELLTIIVDKWNSGGVWSLLRGFYYNGRR